MKVLILVPRIHFYAPRALEPLLRLREDVHFEALLTPKVAPPEEGFMGGLRSIYRRTGFRYLGSQIALAAWYRLLGTGEQWAGRNPGDRRFPGVIDTLKDRGIPTGHQDSLDSESARRRVQKRDPDLILSVFFNRIIPGRILSLPRLGCYNLHPGALPEYRGTSPVFWQLFSGETRAGICLHEATSRLDAGPVVSERDLPVRGGESFYSLYRRLARRGGEMLVDFTRTITRTGEVPVGREQNEETARVHPAFDREDLAAFYARGGRFWRWADLLDEEL